MSTPSLTAPEGAAPTHRERPRLVREIRETLLLAGRSLRTIPRVPERLIDVTFQPLIFMLLFLYVFGSAIHVPGMSYIDFLLPGLLAQQIAFSAIGAGTATASDMAEGVVDRFRSLPISRLSVVTGQVLGQYCEALIGVVVVSALGLILGWSPNMSLGDVAVFVPLVLGGLFVFMWAGVLLGMTFKSPDAVQGVGFSVMLPLSFMAGTFVPIAGMAAIPQAIAEWNPISALVAAIRQLTQGTAPVGGSWPLEHPIAGSIIWLTVLLIVAVPLALRRFQKITSN